MLIAKSQNGWELHTISNGKLSCENFNLESCDIDKIESILQQEFGSLIKEEKIIVNWDNWSGIFIMQLAGINSYSSDAVIKEIYEFFANSDFA